MTLTRDANLTRGLGRSYGDASLPSTPTARVVNSRLADRVIAFDGDSGVLHAEAGLTLRDINRTFLPRGWFVPVTPGTSFVTLGGAVASDVHGKNHHGAGTFGKHVRRLRLRTGTGEIVEASAGARARPVRCDHRGHGIDRTHARRRSRSSPGAVVVDRGRDRARARSRDADRSTARCRPDLALHAGVDGRARRRRPRPRRGVSRAMGGGRGDGPPAAGVAARDRLSDGRAVLGAVVIRHALVQRGRADVATAAA